MSTIIIGAGIVGLHTACLLREKGHEVFVLEAAPYLAEGTSGRNSGVIHAGINYAKGSFKERICIEGNRLTYQWLNLLKVPHRPCGKWVVPEEGQEGDLEPFYEKIRSLPIPRPERVSKTQLEAQEPALRASEAIFVPSTGIMDAAAYVKALAAYLEGKGAKIILNCRVLDLKENHLITSRGEIGFDLCINAAGLWADEIARMSGFTDYEIRPCRGDYYLLNRQPLSRPVYHIPYSGAHGLGIHITPTLDGQTLLGPNAFFIDKKDDYHHRSEPGPFEKTARFFVPKIGSFQLDKGYSGNRPKLFLRNEPVGEFVIEKRGNWIHLLGIESPGLTAAPALAHEMEKFI